MSGESIRLVTEAAVRTWNPSQVGSLLLEGTGLRRTGSTPLEVRRFVKVAIVVPQERCEMKKSWDGSATFKEHLLGSDTAVPWSWEEGRLILLEMGRGGSKAEILLFFGAGLADGGLGRGGRELRLGGDKEEVGRFGEVVPGRRSRRSNADSATCFCREMTKSCGCTSTVGLYSQGWELALWTLFSEMLTLSRWMVSKCSILSDSLFTSSSSSKTLSLSCRLLTL